MSPNDRPRAICFGKLPIAGDFVRGHASAPELATLDEWIEQGMHRSRTTFGGAWQARFDALPPVRFLFHAVPNGPVLAGWWKASRDAAGRRYPFLIAVRLPGIKPADEPLLPVALAGFFAAARRLLDGSWQGLDVPDVIAAVQDLEFDIDLARARAEHAAACGTESTASTWAGGSDAPELLFQDLEDLAVAAVSPRFAVRWPTRGEPVDVSYWLAVLAHFGAPPPCLLLWHSAADLAPGIARAVLGRLEPRLFTGMVFFDHDDDDAYDLGRDHGDDHRLPDARRRFGDVVAHGTQARSLAALRNGVRR
ncbi:MAG TPA: type VI secretion system-associated protein TagF [Planctomycetota bacterium]|nr:type VI secretion system-associated protein TagF [Planctomycetota bacterium]